MGVWVSDHNVTSSTNWHAEAEVMISCGWSAGARCGKIPIVYSILYSLFKGSVRIIEYLSCLVYV